MPDEEQSIMQESRELSMSITERLLAENEALHCEIKALRVRLAMAEETIAELRGGQARGDQGHNGVARIGLGEDLHESVTLLRALYEATPDLVFAKDREGRMMLANPAALRTIGKDAGEVLGRTAREWLADPALAASIMDSDRNVMELGEAQVVEETMRTEAGLRVLLASKLPLRDAHGHVVGIMAISRDITERKRVEEALRESERRYHSLFASIHQGFALGELIHDEAGQVVSCRLIELNPSFERHTRLPAEQVVGRPFQEVVPGIERHWLEIFERVEQTGEPVWLEQFHPLFDSWFETYIFRPEAGRFALLFMDVGERKRAEAALRQSEQRLQRLVQSNIVGVVFWDATGAVSEANDALLALLGFDRDDLAAGRIQWIELTPPEWMDVTMQNLRLLQSAGTCPPFEKEFYRKDGSRVRVLVACAALEPGGGDSGVAFVLDVGERKRAEEALRESEQRLHRLFQVAPALITLHEGPEHVFTFSNALHDWVVGNRPLLGLPVREALPDLAGQGVFERFDHVYRTGASSAVPELRMVMDRHGDGRLEEGFFTQILQPWFGADGQVAGVMGFAFEVTEQVRARAAVLQSEERLRLALEASHMGTWTFDVRADEVSWDDRSRRIFGMSRDENMDYASFVWGAVHVSDRLLVHETAQRAMSPEGNGRYDVEHRVVRPDGSVRWVMVMGQATFEGEGEARAPVQVTGIMMDVTDRREMERALRESEARFRQLVEALPQLVWAWRPDGYCDYLGPQWLAFTGQRVPDHLGDGWLEAVHPDDRERNAMAWQAAMVERAPYDLEYRLRRADGSYRWFHARAAGLRDADGHVVRWFGTSTDIHDRKLAEEGLRDAEERFRTLADNIAQLAWMADGNGTIFWYNKRWFDFTGTIMDEMRGSGWQRVHHPDHLVRVVEKLRRCFASGAVWEDTFPLRGKDGAYRWFLSRAVPIRDEAGKVLRWFGTNTDVTAQREVEDALKEADRRKDEFLAMLAHELRNPLAPIRTAVQVLNLIGSASADEVRMREMIERQVVHMTHLIDDLLDVSRIAQGKVQLRMSRCDLVGIVRDVAEDYRPILEGNGLTLAVEIVPEPLWLEGDQTRLAQIVGNLLHNANKFTGAGGVVTVRVEVERGAQAAVVSIRDTGIGIEPAMLARVFEPFVQADASLDRSRGGLGLGLALVRGLVELHAGTVEAHSDGPGRGSTFALRLPLEQCAQVAPPAAAHAAAEERGGLRVLIIEDNRDAADSLKDLLMLLRYEVEVAYTGPAGLEAAQGFRPDAVLCDIGLPGLDGFAVARALRADEVTRCSYLIAQTGYGQDEDQRQAREAGFDRHLSKPIDLKQLQGILRELSARR
jgi:PAS domain S-box-containing protein